MAIYKVLFEKRYTISNLLTMGFIFLGCSLIDGGGGGGGGGPGRGGEGGVKKTPSLKYVLHILQWWHLAQFYLT